MRVEERVRRRRRSQGLRGVREWLDSLPEHSYLLNRDARILEVNQTALHGLGVDLAALRGERFHPMVETESVAQIEGLLDDLRRGQSISNIEVSLSTAGGCPLILLLSAGRLPLRGFGKAHLLLVGRDVSKQRLQEEQINYQLIHDPLTGVFNRRLLARVLPREARRGERYGHPVAFLMLDIDRFKAINDTYGHRVGDETLCLVARTLTCAVRETDLVIRYGGDEFLVVMPETDGEAVAVADRIRDAFEGVHVQGVETNGKLDVTMGVAHWLPNSDRPIELAIEEADRKMYSARRAG